MTIVESCTVTGDLYECERNGDSLGVLLSPWGSFEIDLVSGDFNGKMTAFDANQVSVVELIERDFSLPGYMASEDLFIPVEEVSSYRLCDTYVINEQRLVTIGEAKFLRPEVLGMENSQRQIIEVYTHAYRTPFSASERMDPNWVSKESLIKTFETQTVEQVEPMGN